MKKLQVKYFQDGITGGLTPPRFGDCGFDIKASVQVILFPNTLVSISTGVYVEIPQNHFGVIRDRSSMSLRRLRVGGGIIDPSYRGELRVLMENFGTEPYVVEVDQRIAQMIVVPYEVPEILTCYNKQDLTVTPSGEGGFGSTGL